MSRSPAARRRAGLSWSREVASAAVALAVSVMTTATPFLRNDTPRRFLILIVARQKMNDPGSNEAASRRR
jgi:hypothetical protein